MKKYLISILFIIFCILLTPLITIDNDIKNKSISEEIKTDTTKTYDDTNNSIIIKSNTNNTTNNSSSKKSENDKKVDIKETIVDFNIGQDTRYTIYSYKTNKTFMITPLDYIVGVVAAEMPVSFHEEALKAQAIAAHTNILRLLEENKNAKVEINPAKFQAYITKEEMIEYYGAKFDEYYKKIYDACNEVLKKVIVYEEEPILASFFSMSSGKTEDPKNVWGGSLPYLKPVISKYETKLDNYITTTTVSSNQMKNMLNGFYIDNISKNKSEWAKIISFSDSNTVLEVSLCGKIISGQQFRSMLGLKSASFSINYNKTDDNFIITTKGYGHGVGLSQNGANELAKKGYKYDEIIHYYYTDIVIAILKYD